MTAPAIQIEDFSKRQCAAGLRAALNILDKWRATAEQACAVLPISRSTYTSASKSDPSETVSVDSDHMQRISVVLNIHAALRVVCDDPDSVYGYPRMEKHNEVFNRGTSLDVMAQGDVM